MNTGIRSSARKLLAAAATLATLGAWMPAQAGYVVVNADPPFGGTLFPNLGWSATGALFIDDKCLALSSVQNGLGIPVPPGGGGSATCSDTRLQDVVLRLYDLRDESRFQEIALNYFLPDQPPPGARNDLTQELLEARFSGTQLVSWETSLSEPELAGADFLSSVLPDGGVQRYRVSLDFSSTGGRLVAFCDRGDGYAYSYSLTDPCVVTSSVAPTITASRTLTEAEYRAYQQTGTVPIPEPASLALSLLALGAAFGARPLAARRRRA